MKTAFAVLALALSAAHAATNIVGDFTPPAPYALADSISIVGDLRLATPGDYSAQSWNISGDVRLLTPGTYTLRATGGEIRVGGDVRAITGAATITVFYATSFAARGGIGATVTLVDGTKQTPPAAREAPPLVNISTRATLAAGAALTPGFVVGGTISRRVLVRAVGPGLAAFGVTGAAAAPVLTVFRGSAEIARATGWGADLAATFTAVGAFALAPGSRDAALVLSLAPGAYTARIEGAGEVLAEVYFVD